MERWRDSSIATRDAACRGKKTEGFLSGQGNQWRMGGTLYPKLKIGKWPPRVESSRFFQAPFSRGEDVRFREGVFLHTSGCKIAFPVNTCCNLCVPTIFCGCSTSKFLKKSRKLTSKSSPETSLLELRAQDGADGGFGT